MGLLSNKVPRRCLHPGDHIYSYRDLHLYSHHGIYVEEDRVIHYTRTKEAKDSFWIRRKQCKNCGHRSGMAGGVVKTCVDCFLKGHGLYRFEYGVSPGHFMIKNSGTCTTAYSDSAEVSISRAKDLLSKKGFGEYNLFDNNCESFAVYCKTNKHISNQAFAAINFGKRVIKFFMKHNVDRLLNDVLVHHPHIQKQFEETIGNSELSLKQTIAILRKLISKKEGEDVDEDHQLDEYLEKMEKQQGCGNDGQSSVS